MTKNCYDALQDLYSTCETRVVWVGSICINQEDDDEKSRQVRLMLRIYSKATKGYIWLGSGNDHSDRALEWLVDASRDQLPFAAVKFGSFTEREDQMKVLRLLPETAMSGKHLCCCIALWVTTK